MSYADELRAHQEHLAIAMRHRGMFDPDKVTAEVPEPYAAPVEPLDDGEAGLTHADVEAELTHDDILAAEMELADRDEVGLGSVQAAVRDAHVRAGLGYSLPERTSMLGAVALSMDEGRLKVSDA